MTIEEKKNLMKRYRTFLSEQGFHNSWICIHLYWLRLYLASDKELTKTAAMLWTYELRKLGNKGRNRTDPVIVMNTFMAFLNGTEVVKEPCDRDCFNCIYPDCILK